ncbi:vitellogenin-1 isoform X2 [Musca domestica]|uniref:Vitellogenin-1 isoform X2 n=1 Tax=Musca domestica TaxID=7370 RepID=A0A9J7CQN4_MUSDO|nr:vitellogenin-1 isoform X2 [Musca domestica]
MKLFVLCAILGLCCLPNVQSLDLSFKNIVTSTADVTTGVIKDVGNKLPTPQGLFETSKQLVAGYPFEFVSSAVNQLCASALSSNAITPKISPNIDKMFFQLRTACNRYSHPLLKANEMWASPEFDPKKKVVILATGWTTTVNETDTIDVFAKAYACRGDVNFVAIDAGSFVDTLYTWSAFNTEELGMHIAKGLEQLEKIVPLKNIHLIGHSLGAHIMGAAARYFFESTGKLIPRVTGLDPAKPCFNEGEALSGLMRGDAEFIDVIHSNSGVLGKRNPTGDVDFYPGGLDPLPPGCVSVTCAHARAWEYFAETIYPGNENNFLGARCTSLTRLREHKCPKQDVPMGYAAPTNIKGSYFMEVRGEAPFGMKGDKTRSLANDQCGKCPDATKKA